MSGLDGASGGTGGSPLGGDARALLDAARGASGPDAAAVARIKARVNAAVGVGAVGASAGVTSAGRAGARHALGLKLGATVAIASLAVGFTIWRSRGESTAVSTARAVPAQPSVQRSPVAVARPSVTSAASAPAPSPPAPAVTSPTSPTAPPAIPASAGGEPGNPGAPIRPTAHVASHHADLAREVALVDRAMAALRRGDPRGAIAAVRMHAAETTGEGQLAEDAAAIEIEALCAARLPVTAKVATFDARWPRSSQRHRLTTVCKLDPSE